VVATFVPSLGPPGKGTGMGRHPSPAKVQSVPGDGQLDTRSPRPQSLSRAKRSRRFDGPAGLPDGTPYGRHWLSGRVP
jgi:hypothetical protein